MLFLGQLPPQGLQVGLLLDDLLELGAILGLDGLQVRRSARNSR